MNPSAGSPIEVAELERLLKAVEPGVLLVPPRLLRRVIKYDRKVTGLGGQVPHRKSYVTDRDKLLEVVDRDDLGLAADQELAATVILIAGPTPDKLAATPRPAILVQYWRLLFHAGVHIAVDRKLAETRVTDAGIRARVQRIGWAEFEEVRAVLRQDGYLLPPDDDRTVYVEFAALYLELCYFATPLVPHFFPTINDFQGIDALLAEDLDADSLFIGTRPQDAPDPVLTDDVAVDDAIEQAVAAPEPPSPGEASSHKYRRLIRVAKKAGKRGNVVRAAIARAQAAVAMPRGGETLAEAWAELDRLAGRLQAALALGDHETATWRAVLPALLERASRGVWPAEGRLLYDLQKVCVDHEREFYANDFLHWIFSLGKRPLHRRLPCQREVLIVQHLRSAAHRLPAIRIDEQDRHRLSSLLGNAVHHNAEGLRTRLRPMIQETLQEVGMKPQNLPERVACHKQVEELLDRVSQRGFLTMGDLRDAVSRNNLKLPDLAGPREFVQGDRLLLANRKLALKLDEVYHGGEFYMRWLQRCSSLAFGTRPGRFLTRYVALPFGGAFVVLEGLQHIVGHIFHAVAGVHVHLMNPVTVLLLGVFFLGLFYVESFRNLVVTGLLSLFGGFRAMLVDLPVYVFNLPPVRKILDSRPFVLAWKYLFKPLAFGALGWVVMRTLGIRGDTARLAGLALFLAASLFLNTRLGIAIEETFTDWLLATWQRIQYDLLPGVFRLVMGQFKSMLESVDRFLYTIDEWLRFRSGDNRLWTVVKSVLGLGWFFVTYVVHFCINVLIEPQINPIKHFPVVTVSHKLVLAFFVPPFAQALSYTMEPAQALTVAFSIGTMIPGVFGFLVWELKENWRLYRANQPPNLVPVAIGHHGETMLRLLRPGFHSGTIPKIYAKLRQAERAAHRRGDWKAALKQLESLHHVEERLRQFVERDFLFLLNESGWWGSFPLHAGAIHLGTKRIRIALVCAELSQHGLAVVFEEHAGWLVSGIAEQGWLERLTRRQAEALKIALAGLYKMAGVDLVREHAEPQLGPHATSFTLTRAGLHVLPAPVAETADMNGMGAGRPPFSGKLSDNQTAQLLFRNIPIAWHEWVAAWEREPLAAPFLEKVSLLPLAATGGGGSSTV